MKITKSIPIEIEVLMGGNCCSVHCQYATPGGICYLFERELGLRDGSKPRDIRCEQCLTTFGNSKKRVVVVQKPTEGK